MIAEEGTLLSGRGEDEEKMEGVKETEMKEIKGTGILCLPLSWEMVHTDMSRHRIRHSG